MIGQKSAVYVKTEAFCRRARKYTPGLAMCVFILSSRFICLAVFYDFSLNSRLVHFVRFENGVVFVKFHGACVTCPISFITLKMGLETQIKQRIPEVKSVVSIDEE